MQEVPRRDYSAPVLRHLQPGDLSPRDQLRFAAVKHISIADAEAEQRRAYLAEIFEDGAIAEFRMQDTCVPQSNHRTDILVVGGNDGRRMAGWMRANLLLFTRVPRICVTATCGRIKRVELLRAGFDAVFSLQETPASVAAHHVGSIWARYLLTNQTRLDADGLVEQYRTVCDFDALREQEVRAFQLLYANRPRIVPHALLQEAVSHDHIPITLKHLRVVLAGLRARLHQGWQIIADRDLGYRLTN